MLLKAAMPFNFSSPEFLSYQRTRKNRVSPVSRASPAHMNSPLVVESMFKITFKTSNRRKNIENANMINVMLLSRC